MRHHRGKIAILRLRPAEALIACNQILDDNEIAVLHKAELEGQDVQITTVKGRICSAILRIKRVPRRTQNQEETR